MSADEEDEVAGVEAGLLDELDKISRVQQLTSGVEKDLSGCGVPLKQVVASGVDFAEGACLEPGGPLDELAGEGRGVFVAGPADIEQMKGQKLIIGPRRGGGTMLQDGYPMRDPRRFSSPAFRG